MRYNSKVKRNMKRLSAHHIIYASERNLAIKKGKSVILQKL